MEWSSVSCLLSGQMVAASVTVQYLKVLSVKKCVFVFSVSLSAFLDCFFSISSQNLFLQTQKDVSMLETSLFLFCCLLAYDDVNWCLNKKQQQQPL